MWSNYWVGTFALDVLRRFLLTCHHFVPSYLVVAVEEYTQLVFTFLWPLKRKRNDKLDKIAINSTLLNHTEHVLFACSVRCFIKYIFESTQER